MPPTNLLRELSAVVRHHLTPTPETRREVERCGVTASVLIVAIVRRVTT